ncbi:MAG: hypothetical protein WCX12_01305 [Candidatus Paceibacterota bacterium]
MARRKDRFQCGHYPEPEVISFTLSCLSDDATHFSMAFLCEVKDPESSPSE